MKPSISISSPKLKGVIVVGVILLISGLLIGVVFFSKPFVIDSLGIAYLRAIKPEDRGLEIRNTSGFCNGTVILTIDNIGDHSVQIVDVYLKDGVSGNYEPVVTSINKEIPEHSSNILVSVWFAEGLLANKDYTIEVFTQRESYIMGLNFQAQN